MSRPLFKSLLLMALVPLFVACASTPPNNDNQTSAQIDPYEGFNRAMYRFNNGLDRVILKPAAKGYKFVMPGFAETGVSNFFSNLGEVRNLFHAGLQGKGKKTLNHTGRFLVNSTVGILGFFDVAKHMGLEKRGSEDLGQTLATWGVGSGPYLVLPFLGPSTLRGTPGIVVDSYLDPVSYVDHDRTRYSLIGTEIIDLRASLLSTEELLEGDRYILIRDAYLQRRDFLINDGEVEDTFGTDLDKDF